MPIRPIDVREILYMITVPEDRLGHVTDQSSDALTCRCSTAALTCIATSSCLPEVLLDSSRKASLGRGEKIQLTLI